MGQKSTRKEACFEDFKLLALENARLRLVIEEMRNILDESDAEFEACCNRAPLARIVDVGKEAEDVK